MPTMIYGVVRYTEEEWILRQYELDIDLKILRAARKGEVLSYTFFQHMREQVLGFKLNIRCLYHPHPTATV